MPMPDRQDVMGWVTSHRRGIAYTLAGLVVVSLISLLVYPLVTGGDVQMVFSSFGLMLNGAVLTLEISLVAIMLGLGIGITVGLSRVSRNRVIWGLSTVYVEVVRGTPLIVQIFIWAYVIPRVIGFPTFPTMLAGLLALGMHSGAYQGEIFRGGIQSVPTGQYEAARSLGIPHTLTMLYVVLPQAFRNALPALNNEFIIVIKDSSLLYAIGILELFAVAKQLAGATFLVIEFYLGAAIIYLMLTLTLSRTLALVERRLRIPGLGVGQ